MEIKIINKTNWNNVYAKLYKKCRRTNILVKLEFENGVCKLNVDLDKYRYLFLLDNESNSTEIIILSENLDTISLEYNPNKECFDAYLVNSHISKYSQVESYLLKDEKNLYYREDKSKIIDVLLPNNYSKDKKYGLLLMFDGQNLYDKRNVGDYTKLNDPYGSWQVDVSMASLTKHFPNEEYIVVGIENTDFMRMNELMMNGDFGPLRDKKIVGKYPFVGYLDNLDDFINETVIPFIKEKHNIDENKMGISGSSCGGVACHYVGLKNLGKYKFILCYTPASALYNDYSWDLFYKKLDFHNNKEKLPFFYYFQGKKDALEKQLAKGNANLIQLLLYNGYNSDLLSQYIEPKAYHNETAWRYAFNYMIYKTHQKLNK